MKPTLLHMYLYTSTVLRSFAAYLHHGFRIKIPVHKIGRAHSAMEVLQSSLILP